MILFDFICETRIYRQFLLPRLRVTFYSAIMARQVWSNDPKDFMKTLIDEMTDDETTGLDIEIQIRN